MTTKRFSSRRYRRLLILAALPMVYIVIAWGYFSSQRREFYPFAPWIMFNDVPNSVTRYVLMEADPKTSSSATVQPVWDRLPEGVNSMPLTVYRAQRNLGMAIQSNNATAIESETARLSDFLQSKFGSGECVLTCETFDPRTKLLTGQNLRTVHLTTLKY